MSILTDAVPETTDISGKIYRINTDFRTCLRTMAAFEDNELTGLEKQHIMLSNLFPVLPDDVNAALEKANWFLNGGAVAEETAEYHPRVYSFVKDANFIFSAFRQTHNIDLQTAELHWWVFLALFMDLGADTTFCNLTSLRKRVKTGKATKEEKQQAREMGAAFDLPDIDNRTLDEKEKEAEFLRLVRG